MLDLVEGVLNEFVEAQFRASRDRWGCGQDGQPLGFDNRVSSRKMAKARDHMIDAGLRELRALRATPLRIDFSNVDGSRLCLDCRRVRPVESYMVKTGRCAGKTVGSCVFCRRHP